MYCIRHEECDTGYCNYITGKCTSPGFDQPCKYNPDTCSNRNLMCHGFSQRCVIKGTNFDIRRKAVCSYHHDCQEKNSVCRNSECMRLVGLGGTCNDNFECEDGLACPITSESAGTCTPRCNKEKGCPNGFVCLSTFCVKQEKPSREEPTKRRKRRKESIEPKFDISPPPRYEPPPLPPVHYEPPRPSEPPSKHRVKSSADNFHVQHKTNTNSFHPPPLAIAVMAFVAVTIVICLVIGIYKCCKRQSERKSNNVFVDLGPSAPSAPINLPSPMPSPSFPSPVVHHQYPTVIPSQDYSQPPPTYHESSFHSPNPNPSPSDSSPHPPRKN